MEITYDWTAYWDREIESYGADRDATYRLHATLGSLMRLAPNDPTDYNAWFWLVKDGEALCCTCKLRPAQYVRLVNQAVGHPYQPGHVSAKPKCTSCIPINYSIPGVLLAIDPAWPSERMRHELDKGVQLFKVASGGCHAT